MEYNSPLGKIKAQYLISKLQLPPSSHVLEVGCGNGKFLHQVLEAYDAHVLGVGIDDVLIEQAQDYAKSHFEPNRFEFISQSINDVELPLNHFDLIICNGATHAYEQGPNALLSTLSETIKLLKPNGKLLLGECYWKQPPKEGYLNVLGVTEDIYHSHHGNIKLARKVGFTALYATTSSDEDWDNFEWGRVMYAHMLLEESPYNDALKSKTQQLDSWMDIYLESGRNTLGYGFYLFKK
ncbi:SAM-dependent methyltransferase [Pseudoalteromonas luteoviolacea]|uniref:Methyltransferase domain-containing protein n=1 Tax=Pseudoalteromonas luteoviolacea S4054 TaxID=1129367 RepID=A0A0F6A8S6_9GAMM|nr:class I SAM-dependent methyltransferase [Pseudoalteromonas luteoviolacea]AOT11141.1 hypothetical protein S4054249_25250 [Pseudoalteromonas luteoviolacea]AOT15695.1 hypothetical protein S40542_23260 [Pseudoalteromonas luteoviolacea]AOT20962.1 hypothetical protein S4054_25170 [Pseudoalteromonas luteoviolacea]KKE82246.1 hypothetical protein N479_19300 [Pseudoalteromonas luteoviolacea S4054]KZN65421.1 hypothetical protein N481_25030 [Pseudoalteromonas luteoviolacea S4047-1]